MIDHNASIDIHNRKDDIIIWPYSRCKMCSASIKRHVLSLRVWNSGGGRAPPVHSVRFWFSKHRYVHICKVWENWNYMSCSPRLSLFREKKMLWRRPSINEKLFSSNFSQKWWTISKQFESEIKKKYSVKSFWWLINLLAPMPLIIFELFFL